MSVLLSLPRTTDQSWSPPLPAHGQGRQNADGEKKQIGRPMDPEYLDRDELMIVVATSYGWQWSKCAATPGCPRCSKDIMSVSSTYLVTAHRNHRPHRDGSRLLPAATRRREDCRGTYPARLLEDYAPQVDQALRYERHSRRDLQYAFSSLEVPLPESSPRHCLRTVLLRLPDTAAPKWLQSTQEASFLLHRKLHSFYLPGGLALKHRFRRCSSLTIPSPITVRPMVTPSPESDAGEGK